MGVPLGLDPYGTSLPLKSTPGYSTHAAGARVLVVGAGVVLGGDVIVATVGFADVVVGGGAGVMAVGEALDSDAVPVAVEGGGVGSSPNASVISQGVPRI